MKKKTKSEKNLALALFGDDPSAVKIVLDKNVPKQTQNKYERMNAGDTNCARE